jgi:fatty-acyl-CoA synthase
MIGAVLHTINTRLSAEQRVYTINHAADDVIIVNTELLALLDPIGSRITRVKTFLLINESGTVPATSFDFAAECEALLAASLPVTEYPDFDERTRATTFYSTGTTGMPKGVYFSHRQLVLHAPLTLSTLASNATQGRFHREDVYMPLTPMFHVHAWGWPYIATSLAMKQVYPGRYAPETVLKLIAQEKVTYSHCVPSVLNMLLSSPAATGVDLSRLKMIIGGAALPRALALAALKRGMDITTGYGLSESCPVLTLSLLSSLDASRPPEEQLELCCRAGGPIGLVSLRVIDEDGDDTPRDDKTSGEVVVRAPWLTLGYLNDELESEELWSGGWMHTRDVAVRNADGLLRITHRAKDVIKVGGEWLSSLALEDSIASHPSVAEVAVIGSPDVTWGEVPVALVVRRNLDASKKDICAHVKRFVERGELPREAFLVKVKFVDAIDKTSVGKINKVALRKKHLQRGESAGEVN